jgi:membrane protease YdiL (CAAX protease family)
VNDWLELLATVTAYLALAALGALVVAGLWWFTLWLRPPWLPMQRIRPISWKGIDVLLAFLILEAVPSIVFLILEGAGVFQWLYEEPSSPSIRDREQVWSAALGLAAALAVILFTFKLLRGARLAELGLTPVRAGNIFAIGFVQWLILTPLALTINELATLATPVEWQEEHLVSRIAQQPLWVSEWVMLFLAAVVFAPLLEEVIFRGILLPCQLHSGWAAQGMVALCTVFMAALLPTLTSERVGGPPYNPAPLLFVLVMLPGVFLVSLLQGRSEPPAAEAAPPVAAPTADGPVATEAARRIEEKLGALVLQAAQKQPPRELAIYTNGLFFAAMHSNFWPSPIALFLLGVGLAWVAYRTSSLVGAVTLHALFNAVAAVSLLLYTTWT